MCRVHASWQGTLVCVYLSSHSYIQCVASGYCWWRSGNNRWTSVNNYWNHLLHCLLLWNICCRYIIWFSAATSEIVFTNFYKLNIFQHLDLIGRKHSFHSFFFLKGGMVWLFLNGGLCKVTAANTQFAGCSRKYIDTKCAELLQEIQSEN